MKFIRLVCVFGLFMFTVGATDCYKPVTRSGLPKDIKSVAVPAFQFGPKGARYRVADRFTDAMIREVIKRGRGLKVQGTREGADAAIEGTIRDFSFSGVILDRDGRARVYEVTITAAVSVLDLKRNKILYDNQNFVFKDSFEFSEDPRSFFNEEDPAVERMAKKFAKSVVSTITNGIGVRKKKGT